MKNNLITYFMNYKVNRLSEYGTLFYANDDLDFIKKRLNVYFNTYINCFYYHRLDTLENSNVFDYDVLEKEFNGKRLELLEEYEDYELLVSNSEYQRGREIINEMPKICLFLCRVDRLIISDKDTVSDCITRFINNYSDIKDRLGNGVFKLINRVRDTFYTVNKFFKEEESYFTIDYSNKLNEEISYLSLIPNIKILDSNYKKTLVDKIYEDYKLDLDKCEVLINMLSKELVHRIINDEDIHKYIINITEEMFERGKFLLLEYFNNPVIKNSVILGITNNFYMAHKKYLVDVMSDFEYCCIQDLSHIIDPIGKIDNIDKLNFFKYIIISNYKDKDKEDVLKIECQEGVSLFITKED